MKKILILSLILLSLTLTNSPVVFANHLLIGQKCTTEPTHCPKTFTTPAGNTENIQCQLDPKDPSDPEKYCLQSTGSSKVFGRVDVPTPLQNLGFGSIGISSFFNALIRLIYMLAAVIFVFMLMWGAIEWLMSGGDKEKVGSAQKRLTNAIIGIILLGVTFAILDLIGIFTGFTFFN